MRYEALIRKTFEVVGTSGDEFVCRCLWHDDHGKPNLYVNAKRGVYLCHACGAKGHLAKMGRIPPPTSGDLNDRLKSLRGKNDTGGRVYSEEWLTRFAFPHDGWERRHLSPETIDLFDLGYDPMKDVLTIPVRSENGDILGVITRRLDDLKPKYLYPKGFPIGHHLFGSWLLKRDQRRVVALVEGSLDAIACWDARVPALGMLGARLTKDQRTLLQRLGVKTAVIFTDRDHAGRAAIPQVHEALEGSGIMTKVAIYRSYWTGKDPDELRPDQRRKAFHSAVPWHRWDE